MAAAASGSGAPPPPPNNNPHGFLNPRRDTLRVSKIKWSEANDIKLLLLAMGRELKAEDYQAIADSFPERPTAKAIQERLTKLRAKQRTALAAIGLNAPATEYPDALTLEERIVAGANLLERSLGFDATGAVAVSDYMRWQAGEGAVQPDQAEGGESSADGAARAVVAAALKRKRDEAGDDATSPLSGRPRKPAKFPLSRGAIDPVTETPRLDLSTIDPEVVEAARATARAERERKLKEEEDREVMQIILRDRILAGQAAQILLDSAEGRVNAGGEEGLAQARAGKRKVQNEGEGEGEEPDDPEE